MMWSATTPGTAEPTSLLLERLIEQNSGLFTRLDATSLSLTNVIEK